MKQIFTSDVAAIGGQLDDSSTVAATEDQTSQVRITPQRAVHTNLRNQAGTEIGTAAAPVRTDPTGSTTQPVSGTVTANAGSGTFVVGDGGGSITVDGTVSVTEPVSVDDNGGSLTVDDGGATLSIDDGAGSITVDGTVAATQSGTWNINNVSGTVSLPTGAATSANQSTEITSLQLIDDIVHSGDAVVSKYAVMGAVLDDSATATVTENQAQSLRMSSRRALLVEGVASGTNVNVAVNAALPAGANNIGDVDVLTLPSLPTGSNTIGSVKITDGTNTAAVLNLATNDPLAVAIVDGSGSQITSFGGGTQYTEGDVDATITGTAAMMEVAGNTLQPVQGTVADGLLVNLGGNNDVTVTSGSITADTELPAAAALADNTSNPTVPGVGAYMMLWDGTNWDRALKGTSASDNVSTTNFNGLAVLGANYVFDGTNWDRQPGNTSGGTFVQGNVAHDVADSDNPVKIGSQATDYQPDTEDAQGRSEVTATRRADLALNLRGEQIEGVNGLYHLFDGSFPDTGLDGVYDDSPTNSTSESIECWNYRFATVGMTLDSTNTPTDIQIQVQVSYDNSNWFDLKNGCLGQWIFDDTFVATAKNVAYSFPIAANYIRVKVTCTGTDASNTFTVDNSFIHLRN